MATSDLEILDELIIEALSAADTGQALVYGGGSGLARLLLDRGGISRARFASTSLVALEQIGRVANGRAELAQEVALAASRYGTFDLALVVAPQSRVLARRWLVEARAGLRNGGALYLAGANAGGVRSLIDDAAALFGNAQTLLTKRRSRVVRALCPAALPTLEWATIPGIALGTWQRFCIELAGSVRELDSLPGVFSAERLDSGTALLLEHIGDVAGARVLDLGCGYGAIGLAMAWAGAAHIDMLDENLYAVAAATRNAANQALTNVRVVAADVRAEAFQGPYDLVATNPPFHQGKTIDYAAAHGFFSYARDVLAPAGRLLLVANSFLRYDTILSKQFGSVKRIAGNASFAIWEARL